MKNKTKAACIMNGGRGWEGKRRREGTRERDGKRRKGSGGQGRGIK